MRRRLIVAFIAIGAFSYSASVHAAPLQFVSDLISNSAPGATSTHTIQFMLAQAVPPSGKITIAPEQDGFQLPSGFDYTDVELTVATSGPYVDRTIGSASSAGTDGVSVTTGSGSSLTITLNSTDGLSAGERVRITMASTSAPVFDPVNPLSTGSYRIRINTSDQSLAALDKGTAMIAVVDPVGVIGAVVQHAPLRSNGLPSGTVAANNVNIELSLDTDELASCRYATTTGVTYDSMVGQFLPNIADVFFVDLTGFQNDTTYTYYVRCESTQGIENIDDFPITFSLDKTPVSDTSVASPDSGGRGGVGNFPDGSSVLYLGTVTLSGLTVPGGIVTVLEDGVQKATAQAGQDGTFKTTVTGLERGLYSFDLYASDSTGNVTGTDSETMSVTSASVDTISGIDIPPSMTLASTSLSTGSPAQVSGESAPGSQVEVSLANPAGSITTYNASTSDSGAWSVTIPATVFSKGTYLVKARTIETDRSSSNFTGPLSLGIGVTPSACSSGKWDLNGDGKVNLIDFSIMLTEWGAAGKADLNCDGTVGLADFSILLFHWTG